MKASVVGCVVRRLLTWAAALSLALVAACSSLTADPTSKLSAEQLYADAKSELAAGNWARARELFGKLEARYPFGRYAQQAQIEVAYAFYQEGDSGQAIAACDRFLKLNPNLTRSPTTSTTSRAWPLSPTTSACSARRSAWIRPPAIRRPCAMRSRCSASSSAATPTACMRPTPPLG